VRLLAPLCVADCARDQNEDVDPSINTPRKLDSEYDETAAYASDTERDDEHRGGD
jgi:hypothetical protein